MEKKNYRHGDVVIKQAAIPAQANKVEHLILAEGEATGHNHAIVSGIAEHLRWNEKIYLRVISDVAEIDHPEHGRRTLNRGEYEIDIQQEWKEDGWTKVID